MSVDESLGLAAVVLGLEYTPLLLTEAIVLYTKVPRITVVIFVISFAIAQFVALVQVISQCIPGICTTVYRYEMHAVFYSNYICFSSGSWSFLAFSLRGKKGGRLHTTAQMCVPAWPLATCSGPSKSRTWQLTTES